MRDFFAPLLKLITRLTTRLAGKKKSQPTPCEFCGARDHDADHCPNAAKYKLFHIDRE